MEQLRSSYAIRDLLRSKMSDTCEGVHLVNGGDNSIYIEIETEDGEFSFQITSVTTNEQLTNILNYHNCEFMPLDPKPSVERHRKVRLRNSCVQYPA